MRNVLEIETGFLSLDAVSKGLLVSEIKKANTNLANIKLRSLHKSIELGELFFRASEYFKSEEARELMLDNGITWTIKEMVKQVYDYSYTEFTRKITAYKLRLHVGLFEEFNSEVKQLRSLGYNIHASLHNFIKYGKKKLEDSDTTLLGVLYPNGDESCASATSEQSDTEDVNENTTEDTSETAEDTAETTSDTIFTLSFKSGQMGYGRGNISVRYSHSEGLVTTNNDDDIKCVIRFLTQQFPNI